MKEKIKTIACTCRHAFQDAAYGKGQRIATPIDKNEGKVGATHNRCTVCKREQ